MGTYLSCGIAKTIIVKKSNYTKEKILGQLEKSIDLNIYMEPYENERYLFLEMKEEFLEKYAVQFVEEQLKIAVKNYNQQEIYKELVEDLKDKKYEELIKIAECNEYKNFQLIEGNRYSNDISYITNDLTIFADIISYMLDGKFFIECYYDMFRYLRNVIIKSSANPIKTSAVISIIG